MYSSSVHVIMCTAKSRVHREAAVLQHHLASYEVTNQRMKISKSEIFDEYQIMMKTVAMIVIIFGKTSILFPFGGGDNRLVLKVVWNLYLRVPGSKVPGSGFYCTLRHFSYSYSSAVSLYCRALWQAGAKVHCLII